MRQKQVADLAAMVVMEAPEAEWGNRAGIQPLYP